MKLETVTEFLDTELRVAEIPDSSLNGLQVASLSDVRKVALAVDASHASFERARKEKAQMILVHHGLFWGKPMVLTGIMYDRIKTLVDCQIALYAAHLPLDLHPLLGNNAQIIRLMGWPEGEEFGAYHGTVIGRKVNLEEAVHADDLLGLLKKRISSGVTAWTFGPEEIQTLGIISGGGLSMLEEAIELGLDGFITGEPEHSWYWTAREAGIHVFFGGHYATETLGVQAVGRMLEKELGLETVFIDLPTGL